MKNPRAFPSDADPTQPGMELLDYFAGQVIVGLDDDRALVDADVAADAYAIAEAMLRERERRQT